jgi:hypothetical protein
MESIKLLLLSSFFIFSTSALAVDAEVIVLETPLLSGPSFNAKVLQRVRKGKRLFIHKSQLRSSDWAMNYNVDSRGNPLPEDDDEILFLKTLTAAGEDAWVPKKYVKVIYNDDREEDLKMNPYSNYDPTDYRIEEPLPDTYPLIDPRKARAYLSIGIGPSAKTNFNYGTDVLEESIGNKYSFSTIYAKKIDFDNYDRFYFGGMFQASGQQSIYFISTDRTSQETSGELGIGPYISYDTFRNENSTFTLHGGFTYNFHRNSIKQSSRDGDFEERLFNGYSLTPKAGATYAIRDFIPKTGIDFTMGAETTFNLPYSLKTKTPIEFDEFWNNSDVIEYPMAAHFNVFIGIRANY